MKNQIMGISKQTGKWSQSSSLKQSKRIWTRIGSGIMLLVLIGAIALPVRAAETPIFEDTPVEAWYYQTVKTLVQDQRQIIKGVGNHRFEPLGKLTVDQFVTMVIRGMGHDYANGVNYWAQPYLDKAMNLGIIQPNQFADTRAQITRQEMAPIIVKAVDQLDGMQTYTNLEQVSKVIKDGYQLDRKYAKDIQKVFQLGIITGYGDHTFGSKNVLTRSEASAVILRLIDKTQRIQFDYDKRFEEVNGSIASHLLGGDNWVDPSIITTQEVIRNNYKEDKLIMQSDIKTDIDGTLVSEYISEESANEIGGTIEFTKDGSREGHIQDVRNLLKRRMPDKEVNKVMDYIGIKKGIDTYLPYREAYFYLDKERYFVRITETIGIVSKYAPFVDVTIWYRTPYFIEKDEKLIMTYWQPEQAHNSNHVYR